MTKPGKTKTKDKKPSAQSTGTSEKLLLRLKSNLKAGRIGCTGGTGCAGSTCGNTNPR